MQNCFVRTREGQLFFYTAAGLRCVYPKQSLQVFCLLSIHCQLIWNHNTALLIMNRHPTSPNHVWVWFKSCFSFQHWGNPTDSGASLVSHLVKWDQKQALKTQCLSITWKTVCCFLLIFRFGQNNSVAFRGCRMWDQHLNYTGISNSCFALFSGKRILEKKFSLHFLQLFYCREQNFPSGT